MNFSKKHFIFLLISMFVFAFNSCSDSNNDEEPAPDPPGTTYHRSVVIYMAAQNSLGNVGASRLDSAEIIRGTAKLTNDKDNVFFFLDDKALPRLYRIYKYKNRTIIEKILTWADDACSSDPATLCSVLKTVSQRYPSLSYGLVLWSHGNGWLPSTNKQNTLQTTQRAFGVDVGPGGNMNTDQDCQGKTGVQMDIKDMAQAIKQSGVHLDYLFFDACLMQNIEVAYELKDVTDYVVGSATSTSAYGGYYTNLIPQALFSYPANDDNVSRIANQYFYDACTNPDLKKYYNNFGNVNSVIKTANLDELAQTTAQYVSSVFANKATPDLSNIVAYFPSDQFNMPDFFDMGCAMKKLLTPNDYQAWVNVARKCIITHNASSSFVVTYYNNEAIMGEVTDPESVLGVTMFIPRQRFIYPPYSSYNEEFHSTSWYTKAGWIETGW